MSIQRGERDCASEVCLLSGRDWILQILLQMSLGQAEVHYEDLLVVPREDEVGL